MRALTVESEDYDLNSVYDPDNLMDVTFFFDKRKHLI